MASYQATKDHAMAAYPGINPTEAHVLHHLFFVNGNGYEWEHGELISIDGLREPATIRAEVDAWCERNGIGQAARDYSVPPVKELYPLWRLSEIVTMPDDVQDDWLEAAWRAVQWALYVPHTWEDDMYLRQAAGRIYRLQRCRKAEAAGRHGPCRRKETHFPTR